MMMAVDTLFAGAGGADLGARSLGFTSRGVEKNRDARLTRDAAGLITQHDDVWTFRPDGKAVGLTGGPPCQTFSVTGGGSGRRALNDVLGAIAHERYKSMEDLRTLGRLVGDERTALVLTPLHFITNGAYRWFMLEQVVAVRPVWDAYQEALTSLGWATWAGVVSAEDYSVPQTRKRAVLIGSLDGSVGRPEPTCSTPVTMADALGRSDFYLRSNYSVGGRPGLTAKERGRTIRRSDQPSVTITSKRHRLVFDNGAERAMTTPEMGILQSFPAAHPWSGREQRLQAGNAMPPLLAKACIAEASRPTVDLRRNCW